MARSVKRAASTSKAPARVARKGSTTAKKRSASTSGAKKESASAQKKAKKTASKVARKSSSPGPAGKKGAKTTKSAKALRGTGKPVTKPTRKKVAVSSAKKKTKAATKPVAASRKAKTAKTAVSKKAPPAAVKKAAAPKPLPKMRPRLVRLPAPPRRPPHEEKERIKKARELRQSEDRQASLYDKAVKYFHARRFDRALSYFQKSAEGPHPTLRHRAKIHIEICQRQKAAGKVVLKTADDHYNYGIKLINERRLEEAKRHLGRALKLQPKAGHIHFATAVLGALRGDREDSYQSLKRAIEIDPHNRFLALHDADLSGVLNDPSIAELLHEEGNARSST